MHRGWGRSFVAGFVGLLISMFVGLILDVLLKPIIVTSVIEMRVVAQILRRESDGIGHRRV